MNENGSIVAKAGIWYTISNLMVKAAAFLTVPLFTRLMEKSQYGEYSNIASWMTVLTIITGFDAYTTVIRSKHDFEGKMDKYVSSVYIMNVVTTMIIYIVVVLGWPFLGPIFSIEIKYMHIVFLYLLTLPAYNLMMTKQRAYYKYKMFAILTVIVTLVTSLFSVLFVFIFPDKLMGRVCGQFLPAAIVYGVIAGIIILKGKGICLSYCVYALKISLPLVPHLLSLLILGLSDRIMIKSICGSEMAAVYSIDHNCVQIGNILFDSVNKAWAPWLMDALHNKEYKQIRKIGTIYFCLLLYVIIGIMLFGPEIVYILGGEEYADAKWALPPLLVGCVFQVAYTMYVNIEFYMKKTQVVALATMIAAGVNIVLNALFIPRYGFVAASLTSLVGFACLYFIHFGYVHKLKMGHVFEQKKIIFGLLVSIFFMFVTYLLYMGREVRYVACIGYLLLALFAGIKYRGQIKGIVKG